MRTNYNKGDRLARLLKLQSILCNNPSGLTVQEMAVKCSRSKKTIYRDLRVLESLLGMPIWEEGRKRGVLPDYNLPKINFDTPETMNIFMAMRLLQNMFSTFNPSVVSMLQKLSPLVQQPLQQYIQHIVEHVQTGPRDDRRYNNLNKIADAWLSHHRIRFWYQDLYQVKATEQIFDTYFVEPDAWGHSDYIVGFCHNSQSIKMFKMDCILGSVSPCPDTYEIPSNFNAANYFNSNWGVHVERETSVINVKLRFSRKLRTVISSTTWHPSQRVDLMDDGSILLHFKVRNTMDFRAWILGWGDGVKVIEPTLLRDQIIEIARSVADSYIDVGSTGNPC